MHNSRLITVFNVDRRGFRLVADDDNQDPFPLSLPILEYKLKPRENA